MAIEKHPRRKIRVWVEVDNFSGSDTEASVWAKELVKDMKVDLGGGEIVSDFGFIDITYIESIFQKTPK
jgi:hypothetical protein